MSKTLAKFRHRQVEADGISFHVVEAGSSDKPTPLFLKGAHHSPPILFRCNLQ